MKFLRVELDLSFTFTDLACTYYRMGDRSLAERNVANAEKGYSTLVRFTSDPKHAERLSAEVLHELTAGMQRLRSTLDRLKNQYVARQRGS